MSNMYRSTKNKRRTTNSLKSRRKQDTLLKAAGGAAILLILVVFAWNFFQNSANKGNGQTVQPLNLQYSAAPEMTIDPSIEYYANVTMANGGEFVIQLYPDKAPITVNSFVFLARQKYFDGVTFHRVLDGFMAQAGDPTGTGRGGPGYTFANEVSDLRFDKEGVVAMANSGRDTNGSQFFITFGPTPHLDGGYTIFGQVVSGMDVVKKITLRDPDKNPSYTGDAIQSITITEK